MGFNPVRAQRGTLWCAHGLVGLRARGVDVVARVVVREVAAAAFVGALVGALIAGVVRVVVVRVLLTGVLVAAVVLGLVAGFVRVVVRVAARALVAGVARVAPTAPITRVVRTAGVLLAVVLVAVALLAVVLLAVVLTADVARIFGAALFGALTAGLVVALAFALTADLTAGWTLTTGVSLAINSCVNVLSFCNCRINPRAVFSKSSTEGWAAPSMVCALLSASASDRLLCVLSSSASANKRKPESLSTPNCEINQLMA